MENGKERKSIKALKKLYQQTKANCCECGCYLENWGGDPLGRFFVLDVYGNYYCMDCDGKFENGDERIVDFTDEELREENETDE